MLCCAAPCRAVLCCVQVWDDPDSFIPERFPLDQPMPNEQNTDYRYGHQHPHHADALDTQLEACKNQ